MTIGGSNPHTVIPPYFADFGMKKSGLKNREIRGQLVFTVMTQITDLNDNISCGNASLHFKTSQYASIYS